MPGTVWFRDTFDAGDVAKQLKDAMSGFGTDEETIINVLGNHTNCQRLEIATAYKTAYGKDLLDDLKSELSGDFEDACLALLTEPRRFDAQQIHDAISGAGTDETALVEILCTKSNCEIEEIKAAYKAEYEVELEEDLTSDTSGYFGRLMVSLMAAGRESDDDCVDEERAMADAQAFYDAGEARWGTDESELNAILCLRSYSQLCETFNQFEEIAGKTIEESLEDECSGDLKEGYLAIVQCVRDKPKYFARRINDCVAGAGTKDKHLIRIIVTRSEIDMEEINLAYQENYETSIVEAIESDCSGDYKKMLIAVVTMQE